MKRIVVFLVFLFSAASAYSQILKPVKWSYASKRISKTEAVVLIKATIDKGWHIYSQTVGDGGPIPTSFSYNPSKEYNLVAKTTEPKPKTKFDKSFKINVPYFETEVVFQQKVKINAAQTTVKGTLEFMVCNDLKCLPPDEVEFSIPIKAVGK